MTILKGFSERKLDLNGTTINFAMKGNGPPLLLLHGCPQTHAMWHKIAPDLSERFTVIASDLRGYGDSSKPAGDGKHLAYAKRTSAADQAALMTTLGFEHFMVAGHDRGARVTHRLCRDYPDRVLRAAVLDIIPTVEVYARTSREMATIYFNWFFFIQPYPYPETLIGNSAQYFMEHMRHVVGEHVFSPEAQAEYVRCFCNPAAIHAVCEDYRAGASIDQEHDLAEGKRKIKMPLLALWGAEGLVGKAYDALAIWREYAEDVQGLSVPGGHFMPEEAPNETLKVLLNFFS